MISKKEWMPLIGMTIAAFVFNTSEFMPVGLLSGIAQTFSISISTAGLMITIYSWSVLLLSLPLMLIVCNYNYRKILCVTLACFACGQFLSSIAPNFLCLVLARFIVACAHAVFWSVASVIACHLVCPEKKEFAMSMIVTGSSIAMIFGLPLGRMIGLLLGWRMTFGIVGLIATILLIFQFFVFPSLENKESFALNQLPDILKNKSCITIYVLAALFASAYYTAYSYIEPFLKQIIHASPVQITLELSLFGLAGLIGSYLFSKYYKNHRIGFLYATTFGLAAVLFLLKSTRHASLTIIPLFLCWGMISTIFNVACQAETIQATKEQEASIAMSIFSGIFNLGIGLGSFLGGQVILFTSVANIGLLGGWIALANGLFCLCMAKKAFQ